MPNGLQQIEDFIGSLRGKTSKVIRGQEIPPEKVSPQLSTPQTFQPGLHYFSVIINELFLKDSRQWFNIFDPMAFVLTEFTYGGKQVQIPFVVGPTMLEGKVKRVPNGMSITDTKVAGVAPYAGGTFALTVILARVRRVSYAKRLLTFIETVSGAFPQGVALGHQLSLAKSLLDGADALFGLENDVQPLAGHRFEYNPGSMPWFRPGFFTLINTDTSDTPIGGLSVSDGRLRLGTTGANSDFRLNDFALYSVNWLDDRSDITELPFYDLYTSARQQAAGADEGAWDRAKAGLATLYQQMLISPDLTFAQTQRLIARFRDDLVYVREEAKKFSVMNGEAKAGMPSSMPIEALQPLALLPNPGERSRALHTAQNLLHL